MFGQIPIGFAQPFALSGATHYRDLRFTSSRRISATALTSFANPFGAALGQLINPMLATSSEKIPDMTFLGCKYSDCFLAAVVVCQEPSAGAVC